MGRKKLPIWAVVAADSRSPRDGRYIEDLGRYYPVEEPARVELKHDRVMYWLEVGAQPTETVRSILSKQGVLLGLHLKRKGKSPEEIEAAVQEHRTRHAEKALAARKITSADRRRQALQAEQAAAEKIEAEILAARRKAAEEKKRVKEAAAKKAQEQ